VGVYLRQVPDKRASHRHVFHLRVFLARGTWVARVPVLRLLCGRLGRQAAGHPGHFPGNNLEQQLLALILAEF
jgi:hypothetical protein